MEKEARAITRISIITEQGGESYNVGRDDVVEIKRGRILIDGDPFDRYFCFNKEGEKIVEINPLTPTVIERM